MMKTVLVASVIAAAVSVSAAYADPYVDYTPVKGAWQVTTIKVDPNHIDDYLIGLKKGFIPVLETMKKHGVIDRYLILQKLNSGAGGNIEIVQHFPSLAAMDPDKERDMAIQKEVQAQISKATSDKMVQGFDKYRTFESDEIWTEVNLSK